MLVLAFIFLFLSSPGNSSESAPRTFFAMGSELYLQSERERTAVGFYDEASQSVHSFESHISTWKKTSTLSQFNQTANVWVPFQKQSYEALKKSVACSRFTDGAFHPGLGQLIQLWGLRNKLTIPGDESIKAVLKNSELSSISFNDAESKIRKSQKDFWFEEGGFAKGAAMDSLVALAEKSKTHGLFLNFSGQIYSEYKRTVGIADPENRETAALFVELEKESMSTSGIGGQHFKQGKKTYGHILNPRTGYPLEQTLKSVTVIHPENLWADCLSTGLLVMSENKNEFRQWIKNHPEIKVILLEKEKGVLSAQTSCHFKNKLPKKLKASQINENC